MRALDVDQSDLFRLNHNCKGFDLLKEGAAVEAKYASSYTSNSPEPLHFLEINATPRIDLILHRDDGSILGTIVTSNSVRNSLNMAI